MTQSRVVKEGIWYSVQTREVDTDSWLQQQVPWKCVMRKDEEGHHSRWATRDLNYAIRYAEECATETQEVVWRSH